MKSSIPYNGKGYEKDNRAIVMDSARQSNYRPETPKIVRSYQCNTGVYASPLANPDSTSVVIFRLHNKFGYSTADWEASKLGSPPICPAPMDSFCSGDVITSAVINTVKPEADSSGSVVWSISGTYTYIQGNVRDQNSHFETGIAPYGEQRNFASSLLGNVRGNLVRAGELGAVFSVLYATGFGAEYPKDLFIDDAVIPIVNFADTSMAYTLPIFSNQFFSQAMII